MYPTSKDMETVHSGTGVFYQAMPAVAADGKNIMKLIPVQLLNGEFVHYQISKPRLDSVPQTAVNTPPAPVRRNTAVTRQKKMKQVTFENVSPSPVAMDPSSSHNKHPTQQQTASLMSQVPMTATPATDCGKSIRVPCQLPVTVKSPALPRGHYLQIPANAQVRTVPASALPAGIKKQIFNSSSDSAAGSGAPNAVYVSPVTTVNQGAAPQCDSALHSHRALSKSATRTPGGPATSTGTKARLKLIPKASQRPNSPIKWVIEEEDSSTAGSLNPATSHGLHTVAGKENGGLRCDVSESNRGKSGQGQDNALIMCNGKVFFVGKKCSLPPTNRQSDSPATATKSNETAKRVGPDTAPTQQDTSIIIQDEPDEVIDLCDDDAWDDSSQHEAAVRLSASSHQDDDNVIFVSYIPPTSEAAASRDSSVKTQATQEERRDGTGTSTSSSDSVTEERADDEGKDEGSALTGRRPDAVDNVPRVCGSEGTAVRDTEGSDVESLRDTVSRQAEGTGVEAAAGSPADRSSSDGSGSSAACSLKREGSPHPEPRGTSPPAPWPGDVADPQLRQTFGITADVRICLQRIDEASAGHVSVRLLTRESTSSAEDDREPANGSKEREVDACSSSISVKRVKVQTEQEASTEAAHTDVTPLKYALFKLNTKPLPKCLSGQSSLKGASSDVENTPVIGYVEPIDEDFLSADEAEDAAAQSPTQCADLNTNRRRMGRMRKRTTCPCCVPGNLQPAVKSSSRWEEPERWTCRTERTSRRGTRTKAARKVCPAGGGLSTASEDGDELQRDRPITRLKELLKEKEATLELMEKSHI